MRSLIDSLRDPCLVRDVFDALERSEASHPLASLAEVLVREAAHEGPGSSNSLPLPKSPTSRP